MEQNFLQIKEIGKHFGKTTVLNGIDISIKEGEFLVLVGPSGCGKSTLLSIIAGLDEPDAGAIHIGGEDVTTRPPAERDIAMVFQSYALYPNMTVGGNIAFGMEMRGIDKAKRDRAVNEVARILHIEQLLDRKPGQLSGGQRQRVAMGRAMVRQPRVFLFDEPLSNLDAKLRVDMRTEIKRLHQSLSATIVYVTHDQIEAMTLATHIAVMFDGLIRQYGTPAQVYNRPADMFVASFIGSPSMNFIPAKLTGSNLQVHGRGATTFTLPLPQPPANAPADVLLGLRAEHISNAATTSSDAVFEAQVDVVEPSGSDTFVLTELGERTVTSRWPGNAVVKPGETVKFACDMSRATLFDPTSEKLLD